MKQRAYLADILSINRSLAISEYY